MLDLSKCNADKLDAEERTVFFWQYRLHGDFRTALWQAIIRADEGNLDRLLIGFPDEINGYRKFSTIPGWWEAVEKKVQMPSTHDPIGGGGGSGRSDFPAGSRGDD